ncbi:MAG TPA: RNA-binding S4 domain-containing protein [Aliidongia sp.]|nr:RNA-binding S4 domain-containing protein [Aliidongia sp.]
MSERIDKWLWHARLCKTRSLAGRLCSAGAVELADSTVSRPAQPVKPGDIVTVSLGGWRRRIEVLAIGTRRGPAAEARLLYREIEASRLSGIDPEWESLLGDDED